MRWFMLTHFPDTELSIYFMRALTSQFSGKGRSMDDFGIVGMTLFNVQTALCENGTC